MEGYLSFPENLPQRSHPLNFFTTEDTEEHRGAHREKKKIVSEKCPVALTAFPFFLLCVPLCSSVPSVVKNRE